MSSSMVLYCGWCSDHNCRGAVVRFEDLKEYILFRHGIGAEVEQKHDGFIIAVMTPQSAHTLMREFNYTHDYIMAHPKGQMKYAFYVKSAVKDNDMRKRIAKGLKLLDIETIRH